jgi:O-antigen ligase
LVLLVIAACVLGLAIAQAQWFYVGILVFGLVALLYPVQMTLGPFAALLPFEHVALGNQGSLTYIVGAASGAILLGIGLAGRRLQRPPRTALWWTFLALWAAVTTLWALDPQIATHSLPSLFSLVILYLVAASFLATEKELDWIILFSIAGGSGAGLLVIHEFLQGRFYQGASMRASLIIGNHETNPNVLAASLLLPMAFAIGGLIDSRRRVRRWLLCCALIIIISGLLATMSRGAVLGVVAIMLVYFHRYRASWRKLLLIFVPLLSPLLLMPAYFFVRWQETFSKGGTGRLDIWRAGVMALKEHILWGAGIGNFPVAYYHVAGYAPRFEGFTRDAHNTYLAIATELGLVGLLLFAAAIFSQFRVAGDARRSPVSPLLVAAEAGCYAILVASMFGNLLWDKTFWFSSMLLMLVSRLEKGRLSSSLNENWAHSRVINRHHARSSLSAEWS